MIDRWIKGLIVFSPGFVGWHRKSTRDEYSEKFKKRRARGVDPAFFALRCGGLRAMRIVTMTVRRSPRRKFSVRKKKYDAQSGAFGGAAAFPLPATWVFRLA